MVIKIEKEFVEWIIMLINSIIKELKSAGIISEDTKFLKNRIKNRVRKSHRIKLIKDVDKEYVLYYWEVPMVRDTLIVIRKFIHNSIPILIGIKKFLNIFNNKDNDIIKDINALEEIWKDRYIYCIFEYPEDEDKFFTNTKFIAKTIDRTEWEVVHIQYGAPKDNKRYSKIEADMKRSTNSAIMQYVNDHMLPCGESFDSFDQAKFRLSNGDNTPEITIPQDEFKGVEK